MTTLSITEQIILSLIMAGVALTVWWWYIWLIVRSIKTPYEEVWNVVKKDPIATAILRVGIYISTAILVSVSFDRFIG